jgi:hypothetical protein
MQCYKISLFIDEFWERVFAYFYTKSMQMIVIPESLYSLVKKAAFYIPKRSYISAFCLEIMYCEELVVRRASSYCYVVIVETI